MSQDNEVNPMVLPEKAIMNIFHLLTDEEDRKQFKLICKPFYDAVVKNVDCALLYSEVRRMKREALWNQLMFITSSSRTTKFSTHSWSRRGKFLGLQLLTRS